MSPSERPTPKINAAMLRDVGLFGGLSDETLTILARELPTKHVETGEIVVAEGGTAREMYVVIGGELEVVKQTAGGGDVRVALFGPGDWFGEMAIVDPQPRSATVRAVAPTMVLEVTAEDVERLLYRKDLKSYALFIMNIARELSRRLRVADGLVAQFVTSVADNYKISNPPPKKK
jgi:CRP-like cAMP-binding protein